MRRVATIKCNADGTWTVRVGRHVEHVSGDLSRAELFEALKWALVSKDVPLEDIELATLVWMEANRR